MTTPRESAAMHRLAETLIEVLAAIEDGRVQREAARERERQRATLLRVPQPVKSGPLLVDAKEAARQLGIGSRTLWRLSAPHGPIPTVRLARRVLYAATDLKLIVDERRLEQKDYGKDSPR